MLVSELPEEDDSINLRTFVFYNEGHTLGSVLKCIISRYPEVQFCGYTVPHPAENKMHFRIQSYNESAIDILKKGLKDLKEVCDHTIQLFESEVKNFEA